jgi:F-type H+-transporting ATPase subunit c
MRKFLITAFIVLAAVSVLSAEGTGYTAAEAAKIAGSGWRYLAHIAIGLGAAGCGVGQGKAVASACEGIARNPQVTGNIRTSMIIGLAMIEAMVIYALVAAFAIGNI